MRDILAHGVVDYHPVIVGPGIEAADHMQEWFEAGAADDFGSHQISIQMALMPLWMKGFPSCRSVGSSMGTISEKHF